MMPTHETRLTGSPRYFVFLSSLLLLLALSAPVGAAQGTGFDPYPLEPADTSSPRDTLQSFLANATYVTKAWRRSSF